MKDVFVSRPTWVPEEFKEGLENFIDLLRSRGLNPRTLGSTDYPTECPLDEVVEIMKECSGAIILGYPQIKISEGSIKNEPITSEVLLTSEWNHIETGLAYAQGVPLLVIQHHNISRGIFDRGTMPKFIHSVDLSDASWPLNRAILGAFKKLETDVNSHNPTPKENIEVTFNETTGTLISTQSDHHYCHRCYEPTGKLVPLKKKDWGWVCGICNKQYRNPDYVAPPRPSRNPFPQSPNLRIGH
jgi:hypothetical protein